MELFGQLLHVDKYFARIILVERRTFEKMEKSMIKMKVAIMVLYEPADSEITNIKKCVDMVDKMIILDNSIAEHYGMFQGFSEDKIIYKCYNKNVGLCAALNDGMRIAAKIGCKWVLILDADSVIVSDIVNVYENYIDTNNTTDVAVLSPVHLFDRSKAHPYDGISIRKWSMTSGCYYSVNVFKELGGFFEELFVDCLDQDYCYRAKEKGYKIVECGQAIIEHYPAQTRELKFFGKSILKYGEASPWRYYMQMRGLVWIVKRYGSKIDAITILWKYFKVIAFFDHKSIYLREMRRGRVEGRKMYLRYRSSNSLMN